MNRKQFIESAGATCRNWNWSWSFINERDRTIIFGEWDAYQSGTKSLILSEDWKVSRKGTRARGYSQSREHVRLIEEEGYRLLTFPMVYSSANKDDDTGPAKIGAFTPKLTPKQLIRIGSGWYASDEKGAWLLPEEIDPALPLTEGASRSVTINAYERNPVARAKCLEHYGYSCSVCAFSFEHTYGPIGKHYIHVHHVVPLSEIKGKYVVNPLTDLIPVCPNCHAMIHNTRPAQSVAQLKKQLKPNSNSDK